VVELAVATALTGAVAFLLRSAAGNHYVAMGVNYLLRLLDLLPAVVIGLLLWVAGVHPSALLVVVVLLADGLPSAFVCSRRGAPRLVLERLAIDLMVIAALSFFGLGGGAVSWGAMVAGAIATIREGINAWWWLLAPAAAITGAITSLRYLARSFPDEPSPAAEPLGIQATLACAAGIFVVCFAAAGGIAPLGVPFAKLAASISLLLGASALYVLGALLVAALPELAPHRVAKLVWRVLAAAPAGIVAAVVLWLFASDVGRLPWLPGAGRYVPLTASPGDWFHALLLPWASLLVMFAASPVAAGGRSFDRAGQAVGLTTAVVVRRRVRLCATNLLAFPASRCAALVSGALVVEVVFLIPGVGSLARASLASGHHGPVQGAALLAALLVPEVLLVLALGRLALDPRQRR
jgi:peptide/nickel transport system permease protein